MLYSTFLVAMLYYWASQRVVSQAPFTERWAWWRLCWSSWGSFPPWAKPTDRSWPRQVSEALEEAGEKRTQKLQSGITRLLLKITWTTMTRRPWPPGSEKLRRRLPLFLLLKEVQKQLRSALQLVQLGHPPLPPSNHVAPRPVDQLTPLPSSMLLCK